MEYLKDKSYYEELYDKLTVSECRSNVQLSKNMLAKDIKDKVELPKGYYLESVHQGVNKFEQYFFTGDRYLEKDGIVRQWMAKDERKDQLCKRPAPIVYCPKCSQKMVLMLKDVREDPLKDELRILYFYKCEDCQQKKGLYNDSEPYIFESDICPKCKNILSNTSKKTAKKLTIISNCDKCGYSQNRSYDLDEPLIEEVNDPNFGKDRKRFCLSREEGEEYRVAKRNLMWLMDNYKEQDEHKEAYEKAKNTKILTVAQISDILSEEFLKQGFGSLTISSPEIARGLIIGFTVQDTKADRSEYNSRKDIKKALNNCLKETNWQIMVEGFDYKLGILTGRLRGQESQEDIYNDLKNG